MSVEDSISYMTANGTRDCVMEPPSVVLKRKSSSFVKTVDPSAIGDDEIEECARETLLSTKEVRMWFSHLAEVKEHRTAGAIKAARTRQAKNDN